jgi:hypothetical protein
MQHAFEESYQQRPAGLLPPQHEQEGVQGEKA